MGYGAYVGVDTMKADCGVYTSLLELFPPFSRLFSRFEADVVSPHYNVCLVCHCVTPPAFVLIIDRCRIAGALISASVTNCLAY